MKDKHPIERLCSIFGVATVFLPCREKGCHLPSWQLLTAADMNSVYLARVAVAAQIGVLCGERSGGLVCLDFDSDGALAAFRAATPELRTTDVRGQHGAKLFFRVPSGTSGRKGKLYLAGEEVGDVLADKSQAVVSGIHHLSGKPYRFADDSPPMEATWEQLRGWLAVAGIAFRQRSIAMQGQGIGHRDIDTASDSDSDAERTLSSSCPPASLAHLVTPAEGDKAADEVLLRMELVERAAERLACAPERLRKAFELVGGGVPFDVPTKGERNARLVAAMPALIRRVAPKIAVELACLWHQLYRELFHATPVEHRNEAEACCRASLTSYEAALPEKDGNIYRRLPEMEKAVFRVCRDLARCPARVSPPLFVMSCGQLALRAGIHAEAARKLLTKMASLGVTELVQKGQEWRPGMRPQATVWRWKLSMEPEREKK